MKQRDFSYINKKQSKASNGPAFPESSAAAGVHGLALYLGRQRKDVEKFLKETKKGKK